MENRVEGIVVEIEGDLIKVRVKQHGECSHCGACGGDLGTLLDARRPQGAQLGSKVALDLPERLSLKAAFVVFLLPLASALAGFGAGMLIARGWVPYATGITFGLASLLYLKRYDKHLAGKNELPLAELVKK